MAARTVPASRLSHIEILLKYCCPVHHEQQNHLRIYEIQVDSPIPTFPYQYTKKVPHLLTCKNKDTHHRPETQVVPEHRNHNAHDSNQNVFPVDYNIKNKIMGEFRLSL